MPARRPPIVRHAFLVLAALLGASAVHAAPPKVSCPDSPSVDGEPAARALNDALPMTTQLLPGTTVQTLGAALTLNPVLVETHSFQIVSTSGNVSGVVTTRLGGDPSNTCVEQNTVSVDALSQQCIQAVEIANFHHPATGLVGDFRNDVSPSGIGSTQVSRSAGTGTRIRFDIVLCPGQKSRPLFLDTNLGAARRTATLKVRAFDGTLSNAVPVYSPAVP